MASTGYRVRLVRGGLEIEVEGDKQFVLDMLARFEPAPAKLAGKDRVDVPVSERPEPCGDKPLSPGEFVRKLGVKKHTDLVLAFGYYSEKFVGAAEFSAGDINNLYYEAKLENSNTSQMLIQNTRMGKMMESKASKQGGGRKKYTLTATGTQLIDEWLAPSEE
ncbi:MAG: hypothetical protein HY825_19845 [Acidobacteria bacterium]|nr:hypothetical protein [Acidobacteriota bacterium]